MRNALERPLGHHCHGRRRMRRQGWMRMMRCVCFVRALSLIHKRDSPPTSLIESTMQEFAKRMCVTLLSWVTWLHMTDTAAGSFHGATPPPNNLPPHSCATPPTLAPRPHTVFYRFPLPPHPSVPPHVHPPPCVFHLELLLPSTQGVTARFALHNEGEDSEEIARAGLSHVW